MAVVAVAQVQDALGKVIQAHTRFFAPLQDNAGQFLATLQQLITEGERHLALQAERKASTS